MDSQNAKHYGVELEMNDSFTMSHEDVAPEVNRMLYVNPDGQFRSVWDVAQVIVLFYLAWVTPYRGLRRAGVRPRVLVRVPRGHLLHRGRVHELHHRVLDGHGDHHRFSQRAARDRVELPEDVVPHRHRGVRARGPGDARHRGRARVLVRGGGVRGRRLRLGEQQRAEVVQAAAHLPAAQAPAAVPRPRCCSTGTRTRSSTTTRSSAWDG